MLLTANANTARTLLDAVLPADLAVDFVLAQELRLCGDVVAGERPTERFQQQAGRLGWRLSLSPAYPTGRGGYGGGVAGETGAPGESSFGLDR